MWMLPRTGAEEFRSSTSSPPAIKPIPPQTCTGTVTSHLSALCHVGRPGSGPLPPRRESGTKCLGGRLKPALPTSSASCGPRGLTIPNFLNPRAVPAVSGCGCALVCCPPKSPGPVCLGPDTPRKAPWFSGSEMWWARWCLIRPASHIPEPAMITHEPWMWLIDLDSSTVVQGAGPGSSKGEWPVLVNRPVSSGSAFLGVMGEDVGGVDGHGAVEKAEHAGDFVGRG